MDYAKLNDSIIKKVLAAVALINNPEIDPEIRQLNQEILFREVGTAIYAKVYDMNAFDYEIEHTRGVGIDDRYYGLAKIASGSVSAGSLGLEDQIRSYLDSTAAKAQQDATVNARDSGKRTKVTRALSGKENCEWCERLANESPYEGDQITSKVFLRHRGCDCQIITEGYRTRNGLLQNYVKPKDR